MLGLRHRAALTGVHLRPAISDSISMSESDRGRLISSLGDQILRHWYTTPGAEYHIDYLNLQFSSGGKLMSQPIVDKAVDTRVAQIP